MLQHDCYNIKNMSSEKKTKHKRPHIIYDFISMKCPEQTNILRTRNTLVVTWEYNQLGVQGFFLR